MTDQSKRWRSATHHAGRGRPPLAVERTLLDNGLAVVTCQRPHLSQAYAAVYFAVGSRHEQLERNGITHFLEHMLFRGTDRFRDSTDMNAAAEALGGFLDGATYRDHLTFSTACHPSAVADAISILGGLVQRPRYRALDVERAIIREEVLEGLDGDGRMIDLDNISHHAAFGRHGLGLPIEGTTELLDSLGRDDLERHRREFLVASNAVVTVAGAIDPARVHDTVARHFGAMPEGAAPLVEVPAPPRPEPVLRYVRDASSQIDLRIIFRAQPVQHPEYPALLSLSRVLADGLASRMHAELVDRRGLAYALSAGLGTYGDCGLFEFDVSVAPGRAAAAVETLLDFAHAAGRFRYTDEELDRFRRRFRYGMQFMADSPPDLASWHGRATLFGVENESQALARKIANITGDDLRRAARSVFRSEGMVVVAVGELARGQWTAIRSAVEQWAGW